MHVIALCHPGHEVPAPPCICGATASTRSPPSVVRVPSSLCLPYLISAIHTNGSHLPVRMLYHPFTVPDDLGPCTCVRRLPPSYVGTLTWPHLVKTIDLVSSPTVPPPPSLFHPPPSRASNCPALSKSTSWSVPPGVLPRATISECGASPVLRSSYPVCCLTFRNSILLSPSSPSRLADSLVSL